jgi:hypothetical protein
MFLNHMRHTSVQVHEKIFACTYHDDASDEDDIGEEVARTRESRGLSLKLTSVHVHCTECQSL